VVEKEHLSNLNENNIVGNFVMDKNNENQQGQLTENNIVTPGKTTNIIIKTDDINVSVLCKGEETKSTRKQSSSLIFATKIGFPSLMVIIAIIQLIVIIHQAGLNLLTIIPPVLMILLCIALAVIYFIDIRNHNK